MAEIEMERRPHRRRWPWLLLAVVLAVAALAAWFFLRPVTADPGPGSGDVIEVPAQPSTGQPSDDELPPITVPDVEPRPAPDSAGDTLTAGTGGGA